MQHIGNKVPAVTTLFWVTKVLTTGMGETLSDFLVRRYDSVVVVGLTAVVFAGVLALQFAARRYVPWLYWLAVVMVGVLGTMVADAAHVAVGVPYALSTVVFLVVLVAVFVVWRRVEGTVDVHAIDTRRREAFYWAAVVVTFALGTAAGDLAASTLGLGYLAGGLVFLAAMLVPVLGFVTRTMPAVGAFWLGYVLTRPIGASFADWAAVPPSRGGLDLGTGTISAALGACIVVCVAIAQLRSARPGGPARPGGTARPDASRAPGTATRQDGATGRRAASGRRGAGLPAVSAASDGSGPEPATRSAAQRRPLRRR